MSESYRIVRFYMKWPRMTLQTGLTLAEAKAHCADPETSSTTCRLARNVRRTQQRGPWFDGYERE